MSSIPPDIYERVYDLALAITNASEAGDDALRDSAYETLCAFHDEQESLGRSYPFLTETLADYTDDKVKAVQLYELRSSNLPRFPANRRTQR